MHTGSWKETDKWMRLPRYPNFITCSQAVTDEFNRRVVGLTNRYIPGRNLEGNNSHACKSAQSQQGIEVIERLNLQHSISHQDIAPRNLVTNQSTSSVRLFDFNYTAQFIRNCQPVRSSTTTRIGTMSRAWFLPPMKLLSQTTASGLSLTKSIVFNTLATSGYIIWW